ncbi:hypothetical protein XENORESO_021795 [Xenotaenia resolanae]|uniref:Uncharacterized protein n=1 Tax=Xenotaenia resolanae TaxID=208358 RepID=A0ABV0W2I6_9TELE
MKFPSMSVLCMAVCLLGCFTCGIRRDSDDSLKILQSSNCCKKISPKKSQCTSPQIIPLCCASQQDQSFSFARFRIINLQISKVQTHIEDLKCPSSKKTQPLLSKLFPYLL